jgi:hypothetical protein
MDNREEAIRQRAYAIWEEQGMPQGEDMRHWLQAWQELADAGRGVDDAAALTRAGPDDAVSAGSGVAPIGKGAAAPKAARKKKS